MYVNITTKLHVHVTISRFSCAVHARVGVDECGVGWRRGGLVLEQQRGVLEAQVRAQRVDAAVGGRAVRAGLALRRVRVEVVPAVGHLLAARLAAPQRRALGRRHEHAVVRVGGRRRQPRALCNNNPVSRGRPRLGLCTRHNASAGCVTRTTETTRIVTYHNLM